MLTCETRKSLFESRVIRATVIEGKGNKPLSPLHIRLLSKSLLTKPNKPLEANVIFTNTKNDQVNKANSSNVFDDEYFRRLPSRRVQEFKETGHGVQFEKRKRSPNS